MWTQQPEMQVLFANLAPEDAGAIVEKLKEGKVPYEVGLGGTSLLVPSAQVHDLRLQLAGQGLPHGGGVGFEIFDRSSLGMSESGSEIELPPRAPRRARQDDRANARCGPCARAPRRAGAAIIRHRSRSTTRLRGPLPARQQSSQPDADPGHRPFGGQQRGRVANTGRDGRGRQRPINVRRWRGWRRVKSSDRLATRLSAHAREGYRNTHSNHVGADCRQ